MRPPTVPSLLLAFPAMLLGCLAGASCTTDRPVPPPHETRVVIREPWTMPEPAAPDELLVIVARKISVVEVELEAEPGWVLMDQVFLARYRVLQTVVGDYEADEIKFLVFDHYGRPAFADAEVVLLPIRRYGDEYEHEKYMYAPLRKFLGRWTGPGGRTVQGLAAEWVEWLRRVRYGGER